MTRRYFEAFWVAMLNGRVNVMEYLAGRGFNVDTLLWGAPVVNMAVGNAWPATLECLVKCGANLDLRAPGQRQSPREMARELFENGSHGPAYRRIVELCGLDADAILAGLTPQQQSQPQPQPQPQSQQSINRKK
ncbi:MAG: hypothetical protein M3Y64_04445 [Gemmatimonadota bacterium]|nr:hypothetical protein [Gemmatimonadota bacterium]